MRFSEESVQAIEDEHEGNQKIGSKGSTSLLACLNQFVSAWRSELARRAKNSVHVNYPVIFIHLRYLHFDLPIRTMRTMLQLVIFEFSIFFCFVFCVFHFSNIFLLTIVLKLFLSMLLGCNIKMLITWSQGVDQSTVTNKSLDKLLKVIGMPQPHQHNRKPADEDIEPVVEEAEEEKERRKKRRNIKCSIQETTCYWTCV